MRGKVLNGGWRMMTEWRSRHRSRGNMKTNSPVWESWDFNLHCNLHSSCPGSMSMRKDTNNTQDTQKIFSAVLFIFKKWGLAHRKWKLKTPLVNVEGTWSENKQFIHQTIMCWLGPKTFSLSWLPSFYDYPDDRFSMITQMTDHL